MGERLISFCSLGLRIRFGDPRQILPTFIFPHKPPRLQQIRLGTPGGLLDLEFSGFKVQD